MMALEIIILGDCLLHPLACLQSLTNGGAQADTTAASLGGESPQTAKGKFAVPNAKWKTLQDIPSFNPKDGAGSPWELALRLDVWKRQVLTLAATVQPLFADYVAECFKQAQERHDRRAAGESLTPLIPVTGFPVLPDSVKTPALEADEGHRDIASLRFWKNSIYVFVQVASRSNKRWSSFFGMLAPLLQHVMPLTCLEGGG